MSSDPTHGYDTPHAYAMSAVPTLQDARILLARVIGDRIMAELVFNPAGTEDERENIASLSTRRDLLSKALEKHTRDVAKATCPYMHS
jgi:aspartate/methionine/tyrosine aminotransferase